MANIKYSIFISLFIMAVSSNLWAQSYQFTPNSAIISNVTISSAGSVITYDNTNVSWTIHPDGTSTNIRCTFGGPNGSTTPPTPTSSIGFEIVAGTNFSSAQNNINPTLAVSCISEGSSTTVSIVVNHK